MDCVVISLDGDIRGGVLAYFSFVGYMFLRICRMWPFVVTTTFGKYLLTREAVKPIHVVQLPLSIAAHHVTDTGDPDA